jgi:hypothetical protein
MTLQNSLQNIMAGAVVLAVVGWCSPLIHAESFTKGVQQKPLTPQLQTGEYIWAPEVSPSGPVVIIVSIPKQRLYVYRNGIRIGRSTISSGKSGHGTPTGVFTILEKNVEHHSSIYKGASMPYMQRLTWTGIAMHAGKLPGYPASHGCVRLPLDFAEKLYTVTNKGVTVIVTDEKVAPGETSSPGLLLSGKTGERNPMLLSGTFEWQPEKSTSGPVSILLSGADRQAYVYRNGIEIGRAAIGGELVGEKFGSYAYTALDQVNPDGSREWEALGFVDDAEDAPDLNELRKHLVIPPDFLAQARAIAGPGTTMIITDQPVSDATRSAPGFDILTAAK